MQMRCFRIVFPALAFGASVFLAQSASAEDPRAFAALRTTAPVAHVYVTFHPSPNASPPIAEIIGFSADSEGRLTPIPGSSVPGIAYAITGDYLFATDWNGANVLSYSVASNGMLTKVETYREANRSPAPECEYFDNLILDHTGATLYTFGTFFVSGGGEPNCPNNSVTQSYRINKETGALTYLGSIDNNLEFDFPVTFTGNNAFAFGGAGNIYGLKRESDGLLVEATSTSAEPVDAKGASYFSANAAADPLNHLAVVLQPGSTGQTMLATYTVNSNGDLTTSSTVENSPTAHNNVFALQMSPSGKLLAVADNSGLRIFHFNGADPITPYTGVLTSDSVISMSWDNATHLYAAGINKLYVFTITPTSYEQAPGSPYPIVDPGPIAVRSLMAQPSQFPWVRQNDLYQFVRQRLSMRIQLEESIDSESAVAYFLTAGTETCLPEKCKPIFAIRLLSKCI